MRIADLPAVDRPRERLAACGAPALSDRELLAVVLGTSGARGAGAHELAERLLHRFGSVGGLARAHPVELAAIAGIGTAKACAVVAAFELARRAARPSDRAAVRSTADLAAVVAPLLRGRTRERLVLVVCDTADRVIAREVISEGAAERSLLPVREALVAVLRRDGTAFALAHNHPGGDPTPSAADIAATRRVQEAAGTLGLRFLDHLVLTDTDWRRVPFSTSDSQIRLPALGIQAAPRTGPASRR